MQHSIFSASFFHSFHIYGNKKHSSKNAPLPSWCLIWIQSCHLPFTQLSVFLHVVLFRTLFLQYISYILKISVESISALSEIFFTNRSSSVVVHVYSVCTVGFLNLLWHLLYCAHICVLNSWCKILLDDVCDTQYLFPVF